LLGGASTTLSRCGKLELETPMWGWPLGGVPSQPDRGLADGIAAGWRAPCAGSTYTTCMQYTIRRVPVRVDRALRECSEREGKSLNEVVIETLARGLDLDEQRVRYRISAGSPGAGCAIVRSIECSMSNARSSRISGGEDRDRYAPPVPGAAGRGNPPHHRDEHFQALAQLNLI
jgi:hypothetical protein